MKKLLTLACVCLSSLMIISLAACGNKENTAETTKPAEAVTENVETTEQATFAPATAPQNSAVTDSDTQAVDADADQNVEDNSDTTAAAQSDEDNSDETVADQDYQGRADSHDIITRMSYDEATDIVLANTDYSRDEVSSVTTIKEEDTTYFAISFYRNGTYVFYVRDYDGAFFTSDEFNKMYVPEYGQE